MVCRRDCGCRVRPVYAEIVPAGCEESMHQTRAVASQRFLYTGTRPLGPLGPYIAPGPAPHTLTRTHDPTPPPQEAARQAAPFRAAGRPARVVHYPLRGRADDL